METKAFYRSKTFWLNLGSLILLGLENQDITALIPDAYAPLVAGIVLVLNLYLRRGANVALGLKDRR